MLRQQPLGLFSLTIDNPNATAVSSGGMPPDARVWWLPPEAPLLVGSHSDNPLTGSKKMTSKLGVKLADVSVPVPSSKIPSGTA